MNKMKEKKNQKEWSEYEGHQWKHNWQFLSRFCHTIYRRNIFVMPRSEKREKNRKKIAQIEKMWFFFFIRFGTICIVELFIFVHSNHVISCFHLRENEKLYIQCDKIRKKEIRCRRKRQKCIHFHRIFLLFFSSYFEITVSIFFPFSMLLIDSTANAMRLTINLNSQVLSAMEKYKETSERKKDKNKSVNFKICINSEVRRRTAEQ